MLPDFEIINLSVGEEGEFFFWVFFNKIKGKKINFLLNYIKFFFLLIKLSHRLHHLSRIFSCGTFGSN